MRFKYDDFFGLRYAEIYIKITRPYTNEDDEHHKKASAFFIDISLGKSVSPDCTAYVLSQQNNIQNTFSFDSDFDFHGIESDTIIAIP
jgi:hypothetical protein